MIYRPKTLLTELVKNEDHTTFFDTSVRYREHIDIIQEPTAIALLRMKWLNVSSTIFSDLIIRFQNSLFSNKMTKDDVRH